jgi:hypothetical protein
MLGLACVALAACGDDGGTPTDAAIDAAVDAPTDTPGGCGADAFFTGEVIDWDATATKFCGVFNARLTVRGAPTRTDLTSPNGRFELCLAREAQTVIDVVFPTTQSECTTPRDTYPVPAVLVVPQGTFEAEGMFSGRAMTAMRQAAMFTQVGAAYDAGQAQLVVHVLGEATAVAISSSHAATQAFDGTAWAAGTTGKDVFFPNVAPGATTVTYGSKTISLTLDPGVFTELTVFTFLTAAPAR